MKLSHVVLLGIAYALYQRAERATRPAVLRLPDPIFNLNLYRKSDTIH